MSKLGYAVATIVVVALAGCGKSKCEKYAEMEWKCGHFPADQKDMTITLARGMCDSADDPDLKSLGSSIKAEAECTKFDDCESYKKCTNAAHK
jgi:hypothetical protein